MRECESPTLKWMQSWGLPSHVAPTFQVANLPGRLGKYLGEGAEAKRGMPEVMKTILDLCRAGVVHGNFRPRDACLGHLG